MFHLHLDQLRLVRSRPASRAPRAALPPQRAPPLGAPPLVLVAAAAPDTAAPATTAVTARAALPRLAEVHQVQSCGQNCRTTGWRLNIQSNSSVLEDKLVLRAFPRYPDTLSLTLFSLKQKVQISQFQKSRLQFWGLRGIKFQFSVFAYMTTAL